MSQDYLGFLSLTILGFSALFLFSCATQQKNAPLPVDAPQTFSNSGSSEVPDRWWTTFENDKLNTAVDTALQSNFNLKTAWQRLRASQAVVDRQSSALFPDLEATAGAETSRDSDTESDFDDAESLSLALSSVYEVDLWGRIRSAVDAEQFRAQASLADYHTAGLSLSAEITRTWYQVAEALNQVQLVDEQIKTNEKVLNLLVNRYGGGQIRVVDILRQKQLLESTREQKLIAESRAQVLENRLAVLVGRPPQDGVSSGPEHLPDLPSLPKTGVPMDLVRRRPDVRSSFNLLQAADRDMASAVSNQYPRLTISASATTSADNAGGLFEDWAMSLAGNLLAPIFRGGELSAEVDRTEAVKRQQLYQYGQTVLVAFREVEDALVQEQKQKQQVQRINQQLKLATEAYEQLRFQYFNGAANYLEVLTALDEVQQLRRDQLSARLTTVEFRIALYRALAGSFETEREEQYSSN
jgi:NodT family efflux transporter outer membrane factor (OMF) lipoprotein